MQSENGVYVSVVRVTHSTTTCFRGWHDAQPHVNIISGLRAKVGTLKADLARKKQAERTYNAANGAMTTPSTGAIVDDRVAQAMAAVEAPKEEPTPEEPVADPAAPAAPAPTPPPAPAAAPAVATAPPSSGFPMMFVIGAVVLLVILIIAMVAQKKKQGAE